jgi:hypothetical protein
VVRHGSAKPLSPVQIRVPPPKYIKIYIRPNGSFFKVKSDNHQDISKLTMELSAKTKKTARSHKPSDPKSERNNKNHSGS